ncbi:uncharacterized protein si:dkey-52l18.4 isoform X2 [Danio aesculapii]|uniref:uncharacterized protein si:dkey-52l18.4 isoform X2 n=1 Tax=Danio aesculapii TaxID=1142201 RepID=UPI0024BFCF56|nr:uncharacterized protein si:dkey-52l18.4 isoform X2 [Danio aesculapii]
MKRVYRWSFTFLAFLCIVKECELCLSVRASRASMFVAEGKELLLRCEVEHCGQANWTGGWAFQEMQSQGFISLTSSERIKLSNYSSAVNSTQLKIHIHNVNQSDAGAYKCIIIWPTGIISSGHVTYVNVTAATEEFSGSRSATNRVLLCLGSLVCFLVVAGLVWCLTQLRSSPPPVPPHTRTSCKSPLSVRFSKGETKNRIGVCRCCGV